jgi:hypothetical protein
MRAALSVFLALMACEVAPALAEPRGNAAIPDARSPGPITVAGQKQLLIDHRFIGTSRNVELCMTTCQAGRGAAAGTPLG